MDSTAETKRSEIDPESQTAENESSAVPESVRSVRLNRRGIGLTESGSFEAAITAFTEALALTLPGPRGGILYNRAEAFRQAGRLDEAEMDLVAASGLEGQTAAILFARGLVAYERDDWEAAETLYRASIEVDPAVAEVWNNLGVVDFRRGNYEAARHSFRKAVELDPDSGEAWFNLADTCDELGLTEERRRALTEMKRLASDDDDENREDEGKGEVRDDEPPGKRKTGPDRRQVPPRHGEGRGRSKGGHR